MTKVVLGPTGTKRRRWTLLAPFCLVALVALIITAGAQAVHDEAFQLDGDVSASTLTHIGGDPPGSKTQALDWDSFFDDLGQEKALPADFTEAEFIRDFRTNPGCSITEQSGTFCTADQTTYATGSKDTLDITPGWQCNFDNNVNSKIDIMNAYAAAYTRPSDDHFILYFGMEKNAFTGTNNVAFWFLQGDANCSSEGGSAAWTGSHQDGDVLVVSEFTSGGGVSSIFAYEWVDPDGSGPTPGFLNETAIGSGGDCKSNTGGDSICATTNSGPNAVTGTITTPWLTSNKNDGVGHSLRATEFFEGGIDITQVFGAGAPTCFNTFVGDTRSSVSLTATLFDYARGRLGECGVSMETEPSTTTCVIGSCSGITDTATVTGSSTGGTAPTPTGDVTFYLCAPSELTPANTGTCGDDNGTQVGAVKAVSGSGDTASATSDAVDTSLIDEGLGKYCFRAQFVGNGVYDGQDADTSNPEDECFTVTGTSGLATAQNWLPNDTATLTGDANLNGTLRFKLFHDATCGAGGGALVYDSLDITVTNQPSGTTFNSGNTTKVVDATDGSYSWLVTYNDTPLSDPPNKCEVTSITITD